MLMVQPHNKFIRSKYSFFINFIVTLLILLITDNPILVSNRYFKLGVLMLLSILFLLSRKKKFDIELFYVVFAVVIIILLQGFRWGISLFTTGTYVGLAILIPYFAIKIVGIKYLDITSKIVYIVAIYSTILYLAQVFIPGVTEFLYRIEFIFKQFSSLPEQPSILFYTIAHQNIEEGNNFFDLIRNAGMFHEPGAFAVFIDLAIVINILKTGKVFIKKNIILLVALASTFSTAGIIAIILVFAVYYFKIKKNDPIKLILITILFILVTFNIWQLPFIRDKVIYQFEDQTSASINNATSGRILGARKALYVLSKYPITGRGLTQASRVENFHSKEKAGYGFMNYFSQLGILFSILFLWFFVKGNKRISYYYTYNPKTWLLLGVGLVINLFSQKFIADSFFTMFFFIGLLDEFSYQNLKIYLQQDVQK